MSNDFNLQDLSLKENRTESRNELIPKEKVGLKRTVGLGTGLGIIVGSIIGSGIFLAPKGILAISGSVGAALLIWLACGIVSLFAALCYAEIGVRVPESGGEISYILRGFELLNKHAGGLLSFLYAWSNCLIAFPLGFTLASLACSTYVFQTFLSDCGYSEFIKKCGALLIMIISTGINLYDVELANKTIMALTSAKTFALIIIIIGGIVKICSGHTANFKNIFEGTSKSPFTLLNSFYAGAFSYDGWNNLNYVTEEIKNPERNLPLAIVISICSVIVIYILANVSYFSVLSKENFIASDAVAVSWANVVLGKYFSWIIPLAVVLSTFGTATCTLYAATRINYVASRNGFMLRILGMLNYKRNTADPSILFTFFLAALYLVCFSNLDYLIDLVTFTAWAFFGLTFASLIIIRLKKKDDGKSMLKIPLVIPIFVLIVAIYFVIVPFVQNPQMGHLAILGILLIGVVVYIVFVHFKVQIKQFNYVTYFLQNFLEVTMPEKDD